MAVMTRKFLLSIFFLVVLMSIVNGQGENKISPKVELEIKDGVCFFNNIKIGDNLSKVEKNLGIPPLISVDYRDNLILFFPDHGMKILLNGEIVASIVLYPNEGISMGEIKGFEIVSRNIYFWKMNGIVLKEAQPQDIMESLGTGVTNVLFDDMGYPVVKENNALKYTLPNSGGEQKLIFQFGAWKSDSEATGYSKGRIADHVIAITNTIQGY